MISKIIPIRLTLDEVEHLDAICKGEQTSRNRSEMIRLLIRREYLRRTTGRSVVKESEIATDLRVGRPREKT